MSRFNKVLKPVSSFEFTRNSLVLCLKYVAELGQCSD